MVCIRHNSRDYLKGFRKRKLERRERAQKELEDEIKMDLKNLRQKVVIHVIVSIDEQKCLSCVCSINEFL
jgi:hypothetical protein